ASVTSPMVCRTDAHKALLCVVLPSTVGLFRPREAARWGDWKSGANSASMARLSAFLQAALPTAGKHAENAFVEGLRKVGATRRQLNFSWLASGIEGLDCGDSSSGCRMINDRNASAQPSGAPAETTALESRKGGPRRLRR